MDNDVSKRVMTQPQKVDYILTKSAEYFGVDKKDFEVNGKNNSRIWNKKKYVALIIHDNTTCNNEEMANLLGYSGASNISYLLRTAKDEISDKSYGNLKAKMIYNELLSYLNL